MKRARTCCFSLTTSFASRRPGLRCRRCLGVSRVLWATSQRLQRTWHLCRSVSPPRRRDPSLRCRQCTCRQMTSPILPLRQPLRTWTPRRCCQGRLRSWVSTPQWILWTRPRACLMRPSSASAITTSRAARRRSCRTTSHSRTSSPSWVWMSSVRRTSSRWLVLARFSASCHSPSLWLRSSPALPVHLWTSRRRSMTSRRCSRELATTSRRRHST
mmetsp:Transcript_21794/g.54518  ORF Transcript_21794/g.54518 Transcript_21794/m.54518 type:complete len:215 (-) Transcript_21794:297-941(-)